MASSIYFYKSLEEYHSFYKGLDDQLIYHIPIVDMFIDAEKEKLFVITNQDDKVKGNIEFFRSIVHVRNENWKEKMFESEFNIECVQHGKVIYNDATGYIEFFPRFLRKPRMAQHADRCLGGGQGKKYEINYDYKFYDYAANRINLILSEKIPRLRLFGRTLLP